MLGIENQCLPMIWILGNTFEHQSMPLNISSDHIIEREHTKQRITQVLAPISENSTVNNIAYNSLILAFNKVA